MASEQATKRPRKPERLEARVTTEQKRLLERAAALSGQTLSDFLVGSAQREAEQTIRDYEVIKLTERDSRAFMEALLATDPPSPRLRQAVEHYRTVMGGQ
ncbi:MAG: DUF1778 domain-containing protein [Dehalococcoidia bacterium]